jgi:protein SCO1/2
MRRGLLLKRLILNNDAREEGGSLVRIFICLLMLSFLFINPAHGEEAKQDEIGINERLGQNVPLDLIFYDESGSPVKLSALIDRPTILSLVYYHCDHICPQVLEGLARAIPKLDLVLGKDYKLITISFDAEDNSKTAREAKNNYITAIKIPFPEDAWKFLIGNTESIKKITDSLGFKYKKDMHGFIHPVVLVILSPDGKIIRYIHVSKYLYGVAYPVTFSPVELKTALSDASQGKISKSYKQPLLFCFPHTPAKENKFFTILKISGIVMILVIILFLMYLIATSKKMRE